MQNTIFAVPWPPPPEKIKSKNINNKLIPQNNKKCTVYFDY
jgi:hypothetical protein